MKLYEVERGSKIRVIPVIIRQRTETLKKMRFSPFAT